LGRETISLPATKGADAMIEDQAEITPEARHKAKLIADAKKRKAETVIEREWIEITRNANHKKGGKVQLCTLTSNRLYKDTKWLYRRYLGREKIVLEKVGKSKVRLKGNDKLCKLDIVYR
jgi:hypothetical protein